MKSHITISADLILRDGWALLPNACDATQLAALRAATAALAQLDDDAVRGKEGAVYAARNVLDLAPQLVELWRTPVLVEFVREVCGPRAGLVRGLFFDKPPQQTWALPWHKDLLIAVADDGRIEGYSAPRLRAGVWHTEPPLAVLESMLTLRIHLDAMTDDNGPLEVLTGSHVTGKELRFRRNANELAAWDCHMKTAETVRAGNPPPAPSLNREGETIVEFASARIRCAAGDVLAMRPLTVHSSGRSKPDCGAHRRVLHLEFSALDTLPGGASWAAFHRVG